MTILALSVLVFVPVLALMLTALGMAVLWIVKRPFKNRNARCGAQVNDYWGGE